MLAGVPGGLRNDRRSTIATTGIATAASGLVTAITMHVVNQVGTPHQGALRQAGALYQFRHARLRDHLALPETSPARNDFARAPAA